MFNKQLSLLVILVMVSFISNAQYEKGAKFWQIEGTFSGSVTANTNTNPSLYDSNGSSTTSALTFKRAVFGENNVAKGWLLGYKLLASTSTSSTNVNSIENNSYVHTIEAGYFQAKFKPLSKSLAIYGEFLAKAGYGFQNGSRDVSYHEYNLGASLNVGVRYYLGKNLFLNGQTSLVNFVSQRKKYGVFEQTEFTLNSIMNFSTLSISIGKSF